MVSQIMMQKMISLLSIPTQDVRGISVFKDGRLFICTMFNLTKRLMVLNLKPHLFV